MKTISALDLRRHVGQLLDEAASGERIIIERSGQPLCALVPLGDLEAYDPDLRRQRRLAALDDIRRLARQHPMPAGSDSVAIIREGRRKRDEQIMRAVKDGRPREAQP